MLDGDELVANDVDLDTLEGIDAVGHRIVHGGTEFVEPVVIDDDVVRRLEALTELAPLHQPKSLRGLELVCKALPGVPWDPLESTCRHASLSIL